MAFKPSARKKTDNKYKEPDMIVVMNLMVCLIPLLLSCAEFVKLSSLEINLPEASSGGGGSSSNDKPVEQKKNLSLNVIITVDGFTIQSSLRGGGIEKGPTDDAKATIPSKPELADPSNFNSYLSVYPFDGLKKRLIEIKNEIKGMDFQDATTVQITAGEGVTYQVLVRTMDIVKSRNSGTYENVMSEDDALFPAISLGVNL